MQGNGRTCITPILYAAQHTEDIIGPSRDVRHHQQHEIGHGHRFRIPHRNDILGRRIRKENLQVSNTVGATIYRRILSRYSYS